MKKSLNNRGVHLASENGDKNRNRIIIIAAAAAAAIAVIIAVVLIVRAKNREPVQIMSSGEDSFAVEAGNSAVEEDDEIIDDTEETPTPTPTATATASPTPTKTAAAGTYTYSSGYTATASPKYYTVSFKNYDGTNLYTGSFAGGTVPSYGGKTPEKPKTEEYKYVFSGWNPSLKAVTGNTSYTAQFNSVRIVPETCIISWRNYDGALLKTDTVKYNAVPSYSGSTPERAKEGLIKYVFTGWSPEITAAKTDTEYTAQFTKTPDTATTYEQYLAATAEEQEAFKNSFNPIDGYFSWKSGALAAYEEQQRGDVVTIIDGSISF